MLKKCSSPKASRNSAGKFFKLGFFWPEEGDRALAILAFLALAEAAKSSGKGRVKRKSAQLGTLDKDYHHKREECGRTEEVATSPECVGSDVRRENCLLKCVSPECYEKIYEADPLEEGELDTTRGRLFKSCVRTEKRKELRAASKDEI